MQSDTIFDIFLLMLREFRNLMKILSGDQHLSNICWMFLTLDLKLVEEQLILRQLFGILCRPIND